MYLKCGLMNFSVASARPPVSIKAGDVTDVPTNSTAREPVPLPGSYPPVATSGLLGSWVRSAAQELWASPLNTTTLPTAGAATVPVSYTHLRAHETPEQIVCR